MGLTGTAPSMRFCTAITESHLPWARVLAESLAAHHRGEPPLTVLVVDGPEDGRSESGEPFRLLRPVDVGIDRRELRLRAAMYRPMEFTGSMRAALLATLLEETAGDPVLFLDADVYVLASLEPLIAQASEKGIVLSPHLLGPPPEPTEVERELLRAGAHNCGYVAVAGDAGARFAAWWAGHLARDCLDDPAEGLFVSQRWLDLAPSLFDVGMLRDPGSNVTPHNLGSRVVRRTAAGWTIDGDPLRFLHVSGGFDPRADEWPWLSREREVTALCREYSARLLVAGHRSEPQPPFRYRATAAGLVLEPWVRRRCRAAALAGEAFPDPFDAGSADAFVAWLAEPVDGSVPPVSRWALALRDFRADLRAVFPQVPGPHAGPYLQWLAQQEEVAVLERLEPRLRG
jgi:hypothetical protein